MPMNYGDDTVDMRLFFFLPKHASIHHRIPITAVVQMEILHKMLISIMYLSNWAETFVFSEHTLEHKQRQLLHTFVWNVRGA